MSILCIISRKRGTACKYVIISTAIFYLFACAPAHMALPPNFQGNVKAMQVEGRQSMDFHESFTFSPFQVTDVHQGWKRTTKWSIMMWGRAKSDQNYNFVLHSLGSQSWRAQCSTQSDWKELEFNNVFQGTQT